MYYFSTNFVFSLFYISSGDAMKKKFIRSVLIPLLFAIVLGFYGAKIAYGFNQVKKNVSEVYHNAYAVQYGVYKDPSTLEKTLKTLDNYVVSLEDGKYYVYLGFTTDYANLSKIKAMYKDMGVDVYIKEILITNEEFLNNLEQFDILLDNVSSTSDILSINSAILSSYDEMILGK